MYGLYQIIIFTIFDIAKALGSPFYILILIIIYYQYYEIGKIEKRQLGYGRSPLMKLLISSLYGILGGILVTISFLYLGVVAMPRDFIYILFIAIILSLINPRFMCFSYGGAIVSLSSLIFKYPQVQVAEIMSIVAVLHMVESLLIILDGWRNTIPLSFVKDKKIFGGFNMNRFWPIPFLIFIGEDLIYPINLMAILNYGDYSLYLPPKKKALKTSIEIFIFSIILLYLSRLKISPYIGPVFSLMGHEYIVYKNERKEKT